MDVTYFRSLARRCLVAARNSFDVHAIEEFRQLAAEFTQKADQLERAYPPVLITKRGAAVRKVERR
jgi:hypothetical protein